MEERGVDRVVFGLSLLKMFYYLWLLRVDREGLGKGIGMDKGGRSIVALRYPLA
jgi:hypothetical protein